MRVLHARSYGHHGKVTICGRRPNPRVCTGPPAGYGFCRYRDQLVAKLASHMTDLNQALSAIDDGTLALIVRDVETHIDEVRPDVSALWRDLRRE